MRQHARLPLTAQTAITATTAMTPDNYDSNIHGTDH